MGMAESLLCPKVKIFILIDKSLVQTTVMPRIIPARFEFHIRSAEEKSILSLVWVVVLEKLPHCVNVLSWFNLVPKCQFDFRKLQEECILEKQAFHQKHLTAIEHFHEQLI